MVKQYTDLSFSFKANPFTGDIATVKGESAISRSIRNLVLTNFYERPHQPRKGSNTSAKLFENFTPNILTELRENIESVIENHESRAEVRDIVITRSGQYGVNIRIEYKSKVSNDESVVDVFLKRVI